MVRVLAIALALALSSCGSPDLPEKYRSEALPGAVDCSAYPEPPAPASCRNLYENVTHPVPSASLIAPAP